MDNTKQENRPQLPNILMVNDISYNTILEPEHYGIRGRQKW